MKYCIHCGKEIEDEAVLCIYCRGEVPYKNPQSKMKHCQFCGKSLFAEAIICPYCGCKLSNVNYRKKDMRDSLLTELSNKMNTNGIIWICVAAIQILIGISGLFTGSWVVLIIGALNLVSAIGDIRYSKSVLDNPTGIVKKFKPLTEPIITLIYNLLVGGVIGAVGSIYYLVAIRKFVLENEDYFYEIEDSYF